MLHCSGGNFKKQFKRADKSGATLALVLGEREVQNNQVVVKHLLGAAEQQTIDVDNLIEHVKAQHPAYTKNKSGNNGFAIVFPPFF